MFKKALRKLGYKITKKKYESGGVSYFTNVSTDTLRIWIQLYNENRYTEEYSDNPDDDNQNN